MIGTKPRAPELQGIVSSKNRRLSNSMQVLSDEGLFMKQKRRHGRMARDNVQDVLKLEEI